jgi:hypothetical protein
MATKKASPAAGENKPAKIKISDLSSKPLALSNPKHIAEFSSVLKTYITTNGLSCLIQGKEYAMVDGWKFAAINFGLAVVCKKPIRINAPGAINYNLYEKYVFVEGNGNQARQVERERIYYSGSDEKLVSQLRAKREPFRMALVELCTYECEADLISLKTGAIIGYGYALCSNGEIKKASFDEYAIASMAQTRAVGKTVKNLLGFIMNAAGFEGTPAEELEEDMIKKSNDDPEDPEATARKVAEGLDPSTVQMIKECKTLDELKVFWDKNNHMHGDHQFQDVIFARKAELTKKPGA